MKRLNSIILILFLTLSGMSQISHYQISEPTAERTDSVIFYKKVGDYWYMKKGVIDTSHVKGLDKYFDDRGDFAWQMVIDTLGFYALKDSVFWVKDTNGINYQAGNIGVGVASNANAKIATDGAVLFGGTVGLGSIPIEGAGTRMMWYADKAAFRAGRVTGTTWDKANVGNYSTAMGYNSTASGTYSTAFGGATTASGNYSTAMGRVAEASGDASTAFGQNIKAFSYAETAIGCNNTTYTPYNALDWDSRDRLFVIGNGQSSSIPSTAMTVLKSGFTGFGTDLPTEVVDINGNIQADTGKFDEVYLGTENVRDLFVNPDSLSNYLLTDFDSTGFRIDTTQVNDLLEFVQNNSTGGGTSQWTDDTYGITYADNIGVGVASNALAKVATNGSVLFGGAYSSTPADPPASGAGTRMMWYADKAAFRAGYVNGTQWDKANVGNYSTAMGYSPIASGGYSTAMGYSTVASGTYSTVIGRQVTAPSQTEIVFGQFNTTYTGFSSVSWKTSDRLFTIANGQSQAKRSTAMTVLKSGFTGFGTDLPEARLHVNGDIIGDTIRAFLKPAYADSAQWAQFLGVGAGSGGGTVTSVGLTSTDLTITGATSPITTSGTFTANIKNAGVQSNHLNTSVISGQTAILSAAMGSTNRLLLHNGTALRSVDLANIKSWLDLDKYSYWQLLTNSGVTTNSLLINSGKSVTLKAGTNMTLDFAEASGSATVTFNATGGSKWTTDTNDPTGINYQSGNVGIGTGASSSLRLYVTNVNTAIKGYSTNGYGVEAFSNTSTGVYGYSNGDYGLMGVSSANHAVYGGCTFNNTTKYAGFFSGGIGVNSQKGYSVNEVVVIDGNGVLIPAKIASAPSTPVAGMIYFNTTDNHFYGYNGTTWKQLDN